MQFFTLDWDLQLKQLLNQLQALVGEKGDRAVVQISHVQSFLYAGDFTPGVEFWRRFHFFAEKCQNIRNVVLKLTDEVFYVQITLVYAMATHSPLVKVRG